MSIADIMLETASNEYVLSKKYPELKDATIECLFNQVLGMHRYIKGLEFALTEKKEKVSK